MLVLIGSITLTVAVAVDDVVVCIVVWSKRHVMPCHSFVFFFFLRYMFMMFTMMMIHEEEASIVQRVHCRRRINGWHGIGALRSRYCYCFCCTVVVSVAVVVCSIGTGSFFLLFFGGLSAAAARQHYYSIVVLDSWITVIVRKGEASIEME